MTIKEIIQKPKDIFVDLEKNAGFFPWLALG